MIRFVGAHAFFAPTTLLMFGGDIALSPPPLNSTLMRECQSARMHGARSTPESCDAAAKETDDPLAVFDTISLATRNIENGRRLGGVVIGFESYGDSEAHRWL